MFKKSWKRGTYAIYISILKKSTSPFLTGVERSQSSGKSMYIFGWEKQEGKIFVIPLPRIISIILSGVIWKLNLKSLSEFGIQLLSSGSWCQRAHIKQRMNLKRMHNLFHFCFWDIVSQSDPHWPWTVYVTLQVGLKFSIFLSAGTAYMCKSINVWTFVL